MPLTSHKEMREVIKELKARGGWDIDRTSGGHLRFTYEDGSSVTASSTPSDPRSIKNTWAQIDRVERRASEREENSKEDQQESEPQVQTVIPCDACGEEFDDAFALSEHVREEHTDMSDKDNDDWKRDAKSGRPEPSNKDQVAAYVKMHGPVTTQEVADGTGLDGPQVTTAWYALKEEPGFSNAKPGVYVYGDQEYEDESQEPKEGNTGRRGRTRVILNFLHKHPGKAFTVEELAEELFPGELENFGSDCTGRVSTAAARLARTDGYRVERVGRGVYRYVPGKAERASQTESGAQQPEAQQDAEETNTVEVKQGFVTEVKNGQSDRLFEEVRELADGRLLLESEGGKLYVARELDLEV